VYAPYIRALLGTASHFCEVVVLKLRTWQQEVIELIRGPIGSSVSLLLGPPILIEASISPPGAIAAALSPATTVTFKKVTPATTVTLQTLNPEP